MCTFVHFISLWNSSDDRKWTDVETALVCSLLYSNEVKMLKLDLKITLNVG